ncbi:hypothetical protein GCM10025771_10640 [Niveibacterium umoris]|uniref:Ketosteroid isomerase-like protein n=1 Tax=Niveibacterium umoris TaxID=1193620 RepID=A0A840BJG7_9RHOO|nr:ketosteroid isomerase-like protein [Niveibacterium umoris]
MTHRVALLATASFILAACASAPTQLDRNALRSQVIATEAAFAHTMAKRDHAAFTGFLAEDTVFLTGTSALRGRVAVAQAWQRYFAAEQAPFSWAPGEVEVNDAGTLALSTGPVRDREGKLIAHFTSIWRRDASGAWQIIFDKGDDACTPAAP